MNKKKKNTARIVDKSSVNYTFTNESPVRFESNDEQKDKLDQKSQKAVKTPIKEIKSQNRHKVSSKKIKSLQGHSPVYE